MRRITPAVFFLTLLLTCTVGFAIEPATQFRRPEAIALSADDSLLLVANRRSGTISIMDTATGKVVAEHSLGGELTALATNDGAEFFACDAANHQLIRFRATADELTVIERIGVSRYPVGLAISESGDRVYVSSLWSRRVTCVQTFADRDAETVFQVDTQFAPRRLLLTNNDSKLIVADSHGGYMTTFATADGKQLARVEIPGHNIRGLAISHKGDKLIVSHQMLNDLAHTVRNDVHWGLMVSNDLRWLPLTSVESGKPNMHEGAHMHPLGEASNATGDPAAVTVTADGTTIVCLAGVDEISFGKEDDFSLRRAKVGKRPTAIVADQAGKFAYIANTFGDSISVFNIKTMKTIAEHSLGPMPELSAVDRGELIFYDARVSHDHWMSCNSCHTDGHSGGLLNDNLSDGGFGAPKRVLSLLGKEGTEPFAWNAEAADYETQIRNSIEKTMQADDPATDETIGDLAAYLRSLPPPPSISAAREEQDQTAIAAGAALFQSLNCKRCHNPDTGYTSPRTYNVKLEDELGANRFNPPSLIGVGQRDSLFHDARAKSLEAVFETHQHQLRKPLSDEQRSQLIAFLRSL